MCRGFFSQNSCKDKLQYRAQGLLGADAIVARASEKIRIIDFVISDIYKSSFSCDKGRYGYKILAL